MISEIEAQRQKFERRFPNHPELWLAKYQDGSYHRDEVQDAWTLFLSGWLSCREYQRENT